MIMYILDSLSLTRATAATTINSSLKSSTKTSTNERKENIANNLISIKVTPTIRNSTYDSYEMTTNKHKQLQNQQQTPEPQQHFKQQNKVVENFMNQKESKEPSQLPHHQMKEMIKINNNENLNDELAMKTIENNTTIADNTMPQDQQHQNNDNNRNKNDNNNAIEWGKLPAQYNCNCHHKGKDTSNNTLSTTTFPQTTDINVSKTTGTNTTINNSSNNNNSENSKPLNNVDCNCNGNKLQMREKVEEQEIMLTNNIQNNVNLNTFVLPQSTTATVAAPPPTPPSATTLETLNKNINSYSSSQQHNDIDMRDLDSKGMFPLAHSSKHSCNSINNHSHGISATYHNNVDMARNDDGGSFCHNGNKQNNNNDNISSSNNNNILNTNSFVTVECSRLACENEREQEIRKHTQNGYKNSGNANAATAFITTTTTNNNSLSTKAMAEFSTELGEHIRFSPCIDSEKFENPIGNIADSLNVLTFDSPVDSVLENFEKYLNSVKLENQNLNQSVPECNDLIDLSDDTCDMKGKNLFLKNIYEIKSSNLFSSTNKNILLLYSFLC